MRSRATKRFWDCFASLPPEVQENARKAFAMWRRDPRHGALRHKRVRSSRPIYSVRIGLGWRALGVAEGEEMIWFWIGSHADYKRLISRL